MSTASPVFHTVELVRLPFHSKMCYLGEILVPEKVRSKGSESTLSTNKQRAENRHARSTKPIC